MHTTRFLSIAALFLATPALAMPDLLEAGAGYAGGGFDFWGPSSIAGTQHIALGSLGPGNLPQPNVPYTTGFAYSWFGAAYSTYLTAVYSTSSTATTTTITGTISLTCQITNATSTPAYIDASASFNLPIQITQSCFVTSTWWSSTGDPALGTASYSAQSVFANSGFGPSSAIPTFASSGAFNAGAAQVYAGVQLDHMLVTDGDAAPQTVTLSFQIFAEVPGPGDAAVLIAATLFRTRRRQ